MIQEANLSWRYTDTESNLILPWYTLPALHWLKGKGTEEWSVFEYGAGYSSIWWQVNSFFHVAVEDNFVWAKAMGAKHISEKEAYINELDGYFVNCVVVDGKWREECARLASIHLSSGGILIIDNWDGSTDEFPQDAVDRTEELLKDWTKVVYKQPNHTKWSTAIFTKP